MAFGLHASVLEPRVPFPDSLVAAAAAGADSFEIDIGLSPHGEPWPSQRETWRTRLKVAAEVVADLGLSLPSLCLGALWQYSLASPDETERATAIELVGDAVTWAAELGATALLLPVGHPPGLAVPQAKHHLVESLRSCLKVAEPHGITLALENLSQRLLYTSGDFLGVLAAVDSPYCGVYFDPGNFLYVGENLATALQRLGSHVVRVHLKDTAALPRKVTMPDHARGEFEVWATRTSVPLGEGEVDWFVLKNALKAVGYSSGFILETPPTSEDGCRTSLEAAKNLV